MAMSSGLRYNEGYGDVSDVTRMLYLEPDMASFTAAQPLEARRAASGIIRAAPRCCCRASGSAAGGGADALSLPHNRLFAPLGMHSAVMEADARGNLVGSSYMYANTLDWARFGQFLLQDGVWQGKRILPEGFVQGMQQVAPAPAASTGKDKCGAGARAAIRPKARIPMRDSSCRQIPIGWKAMTAKASPSCRRSNWWWCGLD
jgi:CubicO group peptidase (beta-lactamase class C family)